MQTIRLHATGDAVIRLQELLTQCGHTVASTGTFDPLTEKAVRTFQAENRLGADGIVGKNTWLALEKQSNPEMKKLCLIEKDFEEAAGYLLVEKAVIKAVQQVESGGRGGFLAPGRPVILFEGHIFWRELKKLGYNPLEHTEGNEDILYPTWTKQYYRGGEGEYDRLEKATRISRVAAIRAASWGMFQILGNNYAACSCTDEDDFRNRMSRSEGDQLNLFIRFIKNNRLEGYLRSHDWENFAARYNGPAYKENHYHIKLSEAYAVHSH
ncbi:MAG: N-acetylmuramidase family protein [Tannerellaceae bacterium]|nr:N-acetylmuramidase family protein [Tannerellaceae bacterium]